MIPYDISVLLSFGIESSMKIAGNPARSHYSNILRKPCVERQQQLAGNDLALGRRRFKMRDHSGSVHSGVCPA
jgi:hypothetical protein